MPSVAVLFAATTALLVEPSSALRIAGTPQNICSRRAALTLATSLALQPHAALADSKEDKAYQSCLSQCVYEATKITKGIGQVEVMSRQEAFGICKPKCARDRLCVFSTSRICILSVLFLRVG